MARPIEEIAEDISRLLQEATVAGYQIEAGDRNGLYHEVSTAQLGDDGIILIEP
ncbi:hypothetical protein NVP1031O_095 [Vibrio phage 1.031.O._10N.261.46.F8]|nr:hypothetical protein NVP1031O_095 [Vibrio phage 1.031.O._10N.261.46.F8]